jgi:hypothetical protein
MKVSKILYLLIIMIGINNSCQLFAGYEELDQEVIDLEKIVQNLKDRIPPQTFRAQTAINGYLSQGLTREKAIRAYFDSFNIDREIANLETEINGLKAEFRPEDWKSYNSYKATLEQ